MKKILFVGFVSLICLPAFAQWTSSGSNISTTQNVGIGTTTPGYKLDVKGDVRSGNIVLPGGSRITRDLGDNFTYQGLPVGHYSFGWMSDPWYKTAGTLWQSGYGGIKFFTRGTYQVGIDVNGNVGIGTETPKYKLDVNGDSRSNNLIIPIKGKMTLNLTDNFTYQGQVVGHYAIGWISDSSYPGGPSLWQSGYGGIKFFTRGTYQVGIDVNGNVGIGTETPKYKLDVNGDSRSNNLIIPIKGKMALNLTDNFTYQGQVVGHYAIGWISDSSYPGGPSLWQSGYGGIKFFTRGTYQVGIDVNGNVGIGTETPTHKLDVNGNIRGNNFYANGTVFANEVKVETTKWSDFVFDKDYKLLPLEDVKAHIEEHKHLPDIPSEKQVIEEGVNVVEMQAKLLQKIEELTLYVIQQDIKNKELEKELKELKTSSSKE